MSQSFVFLYHLQGVYRASNDVRNVMKDMEMGGHGCGLSRGTVKFGKTKEKQRKCSYNSRFHSRTYKMNECLIEVSSHILHRRNTGNEVQISVLIITNPTTTVYTLCKDQIQLQKWITG
jgi:hypothetical protein